MPVPSSPALHELARSAAPVTQVLWVIAAAAVIAKALMVGLDHLSRLGLAPGQFRRGGRWWRHRCVSRRRPLPCVGLAGVGDLALRLVRRHRPIGPRRPDGPVPGPSPSQSGRHNRGPLRSSGPATDGPRRDGARSWHDLRCRCGTNHSHRAPHLTLRPLPQHRTAGVEVVVHAKATHHPGLDECSEPPGRSPGSASGAGLMSSPVPDVVSCQGDR